MAYAAKTAGRVVAALALGGALAASGAFSVEFSGYAPGEALSEKGATGGVWTETVPTGAVCFAEGARKAMAFSPGGRYVFTAAHPGAGNLERFDFRFRVDELADGCSAESPGATAIVPADFGDGTTGFYGWGDGRWNELRAEDFRVVSNAWYDGRCEMRTIEGRKFVRFLVKDAGGDYLRLLDGSGRDWFLADGAGAGEGNGAIGFTGSGAFADFSACDASVETGTPLYWVGGEAGDWDCAANWAHADGSAAASAPDAGTVALITNAVALTRGGERASVDSLFVDFSGGRSDVIGGVFRTPVTLDTDRPRAGCDLRADVGSFLGVTPCVSFVWSRGDFRKDWETVPVGREAVFRPSAADYGRWFRLSASEAGREVLRREFFFSPLPVCYLATDDGAAPTEAKEEHHGTIRVQGNDAYGLQCDDELTIKVRGNSSKVNPKKPYKIKLGEKRKMFGFPKNRHWVLLANYLDMSQLRNRLAYDFANVAGSSGMRSTWVDCVLNGDYVGCYQFCEHIRVGKERVNVYDWEDHAADWGASEDDFSAIDAALAAHPGSIDISGGYLFEFSEEYDQPSRFTTASGRLRMRTMLEAPAALYTSARMMDWCQSFLQSYWDACTSPAHLSAEGRHWSAYADADAMVNYWLVMELFANSDACKKSRFASLDRGGRLVWGPVWDFDWSTASIVVPDAPEQWACSVDTESPHCELYSMFKEWVSDPYFCMKAVARYWNVRADYAAVFADGGTLDAHRAYLAPALAVDDARWPRTRSAEEDTALLKRFLARRIVWLDRQFRDVPTLLASLRTAIQSSPYWPDDAEIRPETEGHARTLRAAVATAATVDVCVNGVRMGSYAVEAGRLREVTIPAALLTEPAGQPNCITLVARAATGDIVARNYALIVWWGDPGTVIRICLDGRGKRHGDAT